MIRERKKWIALSACILALLLVSCGVIYYASDPWVFPRSVSDEEVQLRMQIVTTAESYLGYSEENDGHRVIIDIYNGYNPLPLGYEMTYEDSWCAAFVSAVSIQCKLTDIIPVECGCERQIGLFQELGYWEEDDRYLPLPGDIIYYAWDESFRFGDCTGWSDHVGIVVGTAGPFIKVIEGNKDDCVSYRCIPWNHPDIRGYAMPDYAGKSA